MSEDNEQAVIVGLLVSRGDPFVPSERRSCLSCKNELWVSCTTLQSVPDAQTSCLECASLMILPDSDIGILESTRAELKEQGLSDEIINTVLEGAQSRMQDTHYIQEKESY